LKTTGWNFIKLLTMVGHGLSSSLEVAHKASKFGFY